MKIDKSKWVELTFSQIATSQLGNTLDANKNKGVPYPYLCAANVGMGYFNLSNVKEILLEDSELEKYIVRKGDLLICEGGDTGRCAIWDSEEPIYYQNALHRVRFNDDIHNKFIMYYLHNFFEFIFWQIALFEQKCCLFFDKNRCVFSLVIVRYIRGWDKDRTPSAARNLG